MVITNHSECVMKNDDDDDELDLVFTKWRTHEANEKKKQKLNLNKWMVYIRKNEKN